MLENKELNAIRREIDEADRKIVTLLAKRLELVSRVSQIKKKRGIPTLDRNREKEVLTRVAELAEEKGFDGRIAREIFAVIIDLSTQLEEAKRKS